MAGHMDIPSGSKLQIAFDVPIGQEPSFELFSTFFKSLDESAFLISIPMKSGAPLPLDESRKLLIKATSGGVDVILAGYADAMVKEGIRRYWKIRRVSEQRQFFKRADERLNVSLPVQYLQQTWPLNADGGITKEDGMTLDISAGGAAFYLNRRMDVGDMCEMYLPRVGLAPEGQAVGELVSAVCWVKEAPRGLPYRFACGVQFRFGEDGNERERLQKYTANLKQKYKL